MDTRTSKATIALLVKSLEHFTSKVTVTLLVKSLDALTDKASVASLVKSRHDNLVLFHRKKGYW